MVGDFLVGDFFVFVGGFFNLIDMLFVDFKYVVYVGGVELFVEFVYDRVVMFGSLCLCDLCFLFVVFSCCLFVEGVFWVFYGDVDGDCFGGDIELYCGDVLSFVVDFCKVVCLVVGVEFGNFEYLLGVFVFDGDFECLCVYCVFFFIVIYVVI